MRKNILQSHSNASQLQSRLNKHRYLSKRVLPGGADAKIFDSLKKSQNVPDRKLYPNIYHWYILIRQFSDAARAKWVSNENENNQQNDSLIEDLLNQNETPHFRRPNLNIKQIKQENTNNQNQNSKVQIILTPRNSQLSASQKEQSNDLEYFLNIFSRENINHRIQQLTDKTLKQRQNNIEITQTKIQETNDGENYFIYFKATQKQCEQLKDQVSHWPEIQSFQIKKQKKNAPSDSRVQNQS